jgi:cytochrome c oxidase subunit 3
VSHVVANSAEGPIGPPHVHHMDPVTAYHAVKLGMWLFLATEILLFGGLFCAFALYHWMYLGEYHHASQHLNVWWGATNTVVLLVSSFFAAIAVDAAQHGDNKKVVRYCAFTIICALMFLVIKTIEYGGKYQHGLFPLEFGGGHLISVNPQWVGHALSAEYKSFFGLYYCMTGLHALHVLIGMALLGWVMSKAMKNRFSPDYYTPVELGALYWHLVDLIWIYLFPLLYLVG